MNEQATRSYANVGFRTPLDCFTLCNGRRRTSFRKILAESGNFYPAGGKSQISEEPPHYAKSASGVNAGLR